jgi:hypothetical protein
MNASALKTNQPKRIPSGALTGRSILTLAAWAGSVTICGKKFYFNYHTGQLVHTSKTTPVHENESKKSRLN